MILNRNAFLWKLFFFGFNFHIIKRVNIKNRNKNISIVYNEEYEKVIISDEEFPWDATILGN